MRYTITIMFFLLLGNQTPILAQTSDTGLLVISKGGTSIGKNITISATGDYAGKIRLAGSKGLTLYLDNVAMTGLPVNYTEDITNNRLLINFKLIRDPENEPNRKAWDEFMRTHGMNSSIGQLAIAIGNDSARLISKEPLTFSVASNMVINGTFVAELIIFILAYYWLIKNASALRDKKNGTYSLGRSQMAFWGLVVVLSFAAVWFISGTMERIPPQTLTLLGISGATGLSALVVGNNKDATSKSDLENEIEKLKKDQNDLLEDKAKDPASFSNVKEDRLKEITEEIETKNKEQGQLSEVSPSQGFWQDICDDGNGLSFHRLQVVIWTLVLGVVFVRSVAQVMSMPEFSETLLILMGISNGTYLGFKIPEKT